MYLYHALINAQRTHMIHINLNIILYTYVEHSPTKINDMKQGVFMKSPTPLPPKERVFMNSSPPPPAKEGVFMKSPPSPRPRKECS